MVIEDDTTGRQENLGTSDRIEAERCFHARNEAESQPSFNGINLLETCRLGLSTRRSLR